MPYTNQCTAPSTKVGFGNDNSVSLQTDDAGHVGAAVLAHHVACVVGL